MTKEQEATLRESLAGIDPEWVDEAMARCRELSTGEDITITMEDLVATVTTRISVRVADQLVATRELQRQNAVEERNQRARDAAYEIAMDGMNKLDDDRIVH